MKDRIGVNVRVTGCCHQGQRKYMEDCPVIGYQESENGRELVYAFFGIFDGHGGKEAAVFARENLMNNIVCQREFWSADDSQVLEAIRFGFLATHDAMRREIEHWPRTISGFPSTSGTTSSVAFIRNQKLYVGHVGDSRIVLGSQLTESGNWKALCLTNDHKPDSPEEKERIESVGGLVLQKAGVQRVVWNRPIPSHKGPIRRNSVFEQIPFLAVSRSLGDLWSYNIQTNQYVVSPDPDVEVFDLNPALDRCLIFASDGLWNVMSSRTAVAIVQNADKENEKVIYENESEEEEPFHNPSRLLVNTAIKFWSDLGMRADNVSVVTVMLDHPGPPWKDALLRRQFVKKLRQRNKQITSGGIGRSVNRDERKRPLECVESQEEQMLSEPYCKERKMSKERYKPSVPKNLPEPVMLSPTKVVKTDHDTASTSSNSESEMVEQEAELSTREADSVIEPESCDSTLVSGTVLDVHTSSTVTDVAVGKKEHNPRIREVIVLKCSETENDITSILSNSEIDCYNEVGESSDSDYYKHLQEEASSSYINSDADD